jgi:crossover junction endodeoxyribonuclease RusA
MITFFVDGAAVGKERPRMGKHGNFYTPSKTKSYEKLVGELARVARNRAGIFAPFEDHIFVEMNIYSQQKQSQKLPDIDNIIKSVLDGMNKIIYKDDSQVVALECVKHFECDREGVNILVALLENNRKYGSKPILCPDCKTTKVVKKGFNEKSNQRYLCLNDSCQRHSFTMLA